MLAGHLLLQVGPQRGVLERRPRPLGDRLRQASLAVADRRAAGAGCHQHAAHPSATDDRDREQRVQPEGVDTVRIALVSNRQRLRSDQHGGGCRRRPADDALSHAGHPQRRQVPGARAKFLVASHHIREDQGGRIGLHEPQRGEVAHQAAGAVDDGGDRRIAVQVRSEVMRQLRQQGFFSLASPLALLLDEPGAELCDFHRATDDDTREQTRRQPDSQQVDQAYGKQRPRGARRVGSQEDHGRIEPGTHDR